MRTRKNVVVYTADEADDDDTMRFKRATDMDIHKSVQQIPQGAFFKYKCLVHVKLQQGIREIGASAFKECTCLSEVSIPSSVERIGDEAFFRCTRLNVMLVEGLRTIGKKSFWECAIALLSIPSSVVSIGESAFEICRNLSLLMLREGLQQIDRNAFRESSVLEVDIPSTVTSLGEGAFDTCFRLNRVGLGNQVHVILPRTFAECINLSQVSFPETLVCIHSEAFRFCTRLSDVELPDGLQWIGESAFRQCHSLKEIRIPNTVHYIGRLAFADCAILKEVHFGRGLKEIEEYAFYDCKNLSGISLPSVVEKVGDYAFSFCERLLGVEIQDDSTTKIEIKTRAFHKCDSLINISIPSSMAASVYACAFDECESLERAAGGSEFIFQKLTNRFVNHPVHDACYHSSLPALSSLTASISDYDLLDGFQMTPFHIAVTAPSLREDILECLLNAYHFPVLFQRDRNGKTVIDYLLKSRSNNARDLIDMILRKGILDEVSGWGLPDWRSQVLEVGNRYFTRSEHVFPQPTPNSVGQVFAKYVKLESTSILELALWNTRIRSFERSNHKRQKVDREAHRFICGANIVIPKVLGYLGDLPTLTSSSMPPSIVF